MFDSSDPSKQKKIIKSPSSGPVPEVVLEEILSQVTQDIEQELGQRCPQEQLAGIRLGYQLFKKAGLRQAGADRLPGGIQSSLSSFREKLETLFLSLGLNKTRIPSVESYWIGFGNHPLYEIFLKYTESSTDEKDSHPEIEIALADECIPPDFIDILARNAKAKILEKITPDAIKDKELHVWLFGHIDLTEVRLFGYFGCCYNRRKKLQNGKCSGSLCWYSNPF